MISYINVINIITFIIIIIIINNNNNIIIVMNITKFIMFEFIKISVVLYMAGCNGFCWHGSTDKFGRGKK